MLRNSVYIILSACPLAAIAAPAFAIDQGTPVQNGPENFGNPDGLGNFGNANSPNCPDCPKPRQHYDSQEVA
jgi:hypothetical protein